MPIEASIEFDELSMARLFNQMQRAEDELGKSLGQSVRFGAWALASSLGASTKVSAKKRPVIKNPEKRARGASKIGYARWGIEAYKRSGQKVFVPVYGQNELGKIYFVGKHNGIALMKDKATGRVQRAEGSMESNSYSKAFVTRSPRRIIGRYGLAKASWMWGIKKLGTASGAGTGASADAKSEAVKHIQVQQNLRDRNPSVWIANTLRYIRSALENGPQDVQTAMARAARRMEHVIDANVAKMKARIEGAA